MRESTTEQGIVGIDLGTTNSLIAIAEASGVRLLGARGESPLVPSVVRYGEARAEAVGEAARQGAADAPSRTIFSAKRLMGRAFTEVRDEIATLPYAVVAGPRGMAAIDLGDRVVTPQEVAATLLDHLRRRAEAALGRPVGRAVVTVPAYFDDAQRQATRDAGRLAGLEVVRIINEPTAAALAYGIGLRGGPAQTVAIFDLGGGTFDISILRVEPGRDATTNANAKAHPERDGPTDSVGPLFEVLSTAGDTQLGGDDLDREIVRLLERMLDEAGHAVPSTPTWRELVRSAAERAKIELSEGDRIDVMLPIGPERTVTLALERAAIETLAAPLIARALRCVDRAIADARLERSAIERVILVGGSTRMPAVRAAVAAHFGAEPYTALDPDQVVAIGAALQAAALGGTRLDLLLLDVIPLSLGIETVGGAVAKLIMRNSAVPARATEMFSTSVDGQVSVRIHVLQGERELVRDCRSLGTFDLRGIPPMPAGIPQIEVEFLVDANGILSVAAVERRSGRRASIQVVPAHGLTVEEVDRIERESFEHAREDMQAHRVIDLMVNAQLDVKWIRAALARVVDEIPAVTRTDVEARIRSIEELIATAREDRTAVDADAFHREKQALDEASVPIHELAIAQSLRGADADRRGG